MTHLGVSSANHISKCAAHGNPNKAYYRSVFLGKKNKIMEGILIQTNSLCNERLEENIKKNLIFSHTLVQAKLKTKKKM